MHLGPTKAQNWVKNYVKAHWKKKNQKVWLLNRDSFHSFHIRRKKRKRREKVLGLKKDSKFKAILGENQWKRRIQIKISMFSGDHLKKSGNPTVS